jgi:hypothetical protein
MAQTIDDILAAPGLKSAEMRIVLAEARGQQTPTEYSEFVPYALSIGMGRANAYNMAEIWCPDSRPSGESPHKPGGRGSNSSSTTTGGNGVKPLRSEARSRPKIGSGPSKVWIEEALPESSTSPKIGQRTFQDKPDLPPAA